MYTYIRITHTPPNTPPASGIQELHIRLTCVSSSPIHVDARKCTKGVDSIYIYICLHTYTCVCVRARARVTHLAPPPPVCRSYISLSR